MRPVAPGAPITVSVYLRPAPGEDDAAFRSRGALRAARAQTHAPDWRSMRDGQRDDRLSLASFAARSTSAILRIRSSPFPVPSLMPSAPVSRASSPRGPRSAALYAWPAEYHHAAPSALSGTPPERDAERKPRVPTHGSGVRAATRVSSARRELCSSLRSVPASAPVAPVFDDNWQRCCPVYPQGSCALPAPTRP